MPATPPSTALPADEILYESERTRVYRRHLAGGSIICKQVFGAEALRRLRNERTLLERLQAVDGVIKLANAPTPEDTLALQDLAGVPLVQVLHSPPWSIDAVLDLAYRLSLILDALHRQGVVHKDINPSNIVLVGPTRQPVLIDFNIASSFAQEQPGFTHESKIAGTLAYMAPEQTGRTGRVVDQRADLYALGVTLYELAVGSRPFVGEDLLDLIHAHLVRLPEPPERVQHAVPAALSDIILRLLEKEADKRYQSAIGLARDLATLRQRWSQGQGDSFALGEHDFPLRLMPPSRLVGREAELAVLRTGFEAALRGQGRGLLVAGAPGVGKTALINELRPWVTAQRGWFVSGKFDQLRQDVATDAPQQALRTLGRLLLAEPESELAPLRETILRSLGSDAGYVCALLPEFGLLLGVEPESSLADDPRKAELRFVEAALQLLRAVASPVRPVVLVIDDLQWSTPTPMRFFDAVLTDPLMSAVLLVGAYRSAEVDATHPLNAMLQRWQQLQAPPPVLHLQNLPAADLSQMLAEMLRLAPEPAAQLAEAVGAHTGGNPFDTVELVNALRSDDVLTLSEQGWSWDAQGLRRYVGRGEVVDLLATRIARLPQSTQVLLDVMASLGGQLELSMLNLASAQTSQNLDADLQPALEEGLLVMEGGFAPAVRFRHDRVQQAARARLSEPARRDLYLTLGRRLAVQPSLQMQAAEQYLQAVDCVSDADERRRVAHLLYAAAAGARRTSYSVAERFLTQAVNLLGAVELESDAPLLLQWELERHTVLHVLGRHQDVDESYRRIEQRCLDPLILAQTARTQLASLNDRGQQAQALALGLGLLHRLGFDPPAGNLVLALKDRWGDFEHWAGQLNLERDLQRTPVTDPRILAAARIISATLTPAIFSDHSVVCWLVLESRRLWDEYGPCPGLPATLGATPMVTIGFRGDYRTGYLVSRHALSVSEQRDTPEDLARIRTMFTIYAAHWFEPLEASLHHAQQARESAMQAGVVQSACFTYHATLLAALDSSAALETSVAAAEAASAFAARTSNTHSQACFITYHQLMRALRGETDAPGSLSAAPFDEAVHVAGLGNNPIALSTYHTLRGLSAAIFGDAPRLMQHAAAAMSLASRQGVYRAVLAHLLQGLALAQRVAGSDVQDPSGARAVWLKEFDQCQAWMAQRALDAPGNYAHLTKWLEAERAWAIGDSWRAAAAFDVLLRELDIRQRPWHRALGLERAARFHLSHGLVHTGSQLLQESMRAYELWGASGKVQELRRQHLFLRRASTVSLAGGATQHTQSTALSSDAVDMLAVLRASQALSSETNLDRLKSRVIELLGSLTGAETVLLILRGEDGHSWYLPAQAGEAQAALSVEEAAARGVLPISVFRYAARTSKPLLVQDAKQDDRFVRDPYWADVAFSSVLAVPILSQGEPRALLLMENRLTRSAFSADRLDAVMLIAGQLAVSLDNALLYASLERKVAERTAALEEANQRLEQLSVTDALTGLANRRRFNEALESEFLRARRAAQPMGLAMIDIDHFKLYNDHYGHQGGDACLQLVAKTMKSSLRVGSDLVARYGGEEFVLLLPNTDLEGAYVVAERMRAAIEALHEPHLKATLGIVTVSIGVVSFVPGADTQAKRYLEVADAALYEVKRAGRNRVARGA